MKNIFLSLLFVVSTLGAVTLDEIIKFSLENSPSLEVIEAKLAANKQTRNIANQFANPELSLTSNSLDVSEPMSQTVLTLKQKVYYFDKRKTKEKVATAQEEVLVQKLLLARVELVGAIKQEAYTLWEFEEQKEILSRYVQLTKRNISLYESYASVDAKDHIGIIKAQLSLADLKIKIADLNAKITGTYARLSYLASFKVTNLELELLLDQKPNLEFLQKSLLTNPAIAIKEKEVKKQQANVELSKISNYPDINIMTGYAYREKFDNYFNFGVALSLPIYGTEDAKEEEQKALKLSYVSQKEDTTIAINATLEMYYAQMDAAYTIYHIIQKDSLPQVEHMFELSNTAVSVGGDLFKYIDILFEKLSLEQKSINAVSIYNKAKAKTEELAGALQ